MAAKTPPSSGPVHYELKPNVDTDGTSTASAEKESAEIWQNARKRKDEKAKGDKAVAEAKTALAVAQKKAGKKAKRQKLTKQQEKDLRDAAAKDAESDPLHTESQAAYQKEWKQATLARWDATGHKDVADQLRSQGWVDQVPGSGDDAFEDIYAAHKNQYDSWRRPLLKALYPKGGDKLIFDPAWQPEANVSYIDESGKKQYPDAKSDPFWVSNYHPIIKNKKIVGYAGYPPGTWAKISDDQGYYVWAQAKDSNSKLGISPTGAADGSDGRQIEASPGLWSNMHDADGNNAGYEGSGTSGITQNGDQVPGRKFNVDVYPGSDGGVKTDDMKPMTPEQNEEAGKRLESGKSKSIKDGDDLERQKAKDAEQAKEPQKTAGLLLLDGFPGPDQVLYGPDGNEVGYAHPICKHSGNSYVEEGSSTVCIGPGMDPLSRITDQTKDGLNVVSGALDMDVGGPAVVGQKC